MERTLRWRRAQSYLEESSEFLDSQSPALPAGELATLSTTLALVSASGWHQLVSNPAREGELTTRLPLGNITSCKGLRRGQRLPPLALIRQGRDWLEPSGPLPCCCLVLALVTPPRGAPPCPPCPGPYGGCTPRFACKVQRRTPASSVRIAGPSSIPGDNTSNSTSYSEYL